MENNETQKKNMVKVFNFNAAYVAPEYKWNKSHHFVEWGSDNKYPEYLLKLYNYYGSTTHKSIINKKVRLSSGYGLKSILNPQLKDFVDKNKLDRVISKCDVDFEIYNGFCFEIVWNNEGSSFDVHYVPLHKIRRGLEDKEIDFPHFLYSKDWDQYKKDEYHPEVIREFDPNIRTGRQLFYYIESNPQQDELYPISNYTTGINYIELDYEISKFHLNQVKQGFQPSFILNFGTGIPSVEEMDDFYRDFKRNYAGTDNGGKIIITYSEGQDQAPQLTPIQLNDSDERFIMLQDMVEKNIVMSHEIPPQLVVLTPGKLGSTDERKELLNEFQQYYISPRQQQLEWAFNDVIDVLGYSEKLVLKTYKDDQQQITPTQIQ